MKRFLLPLFVLLGGAVLPSCATQEVFPGTTIPRTEENERIIRTIEDYRTRLVNRDPDGLLVLASQSYFEDSGTPRSDDDYGYEGLKQVLRSRLQRLHTIWYDIEYRKISTSGDKAEVEVYLNGSFELATESGDRYRRVADYHHFKLQRDGNDNWKFLAGM